MIDIIEEYRKFFTSRIKKELNTIILQGDWTSDKRIDIIKRVNNISDKDELLVNYNKDFDETRVFYKKEYKGVTKND